MQKITQRDKKILIALVAIAVLAIYCQFVLFPSLRSISQSKSAMKDLKLKEDQMEMVRLQNISMKKNLKKITNEYDASKSKLPVNERNPEIEYDIQGIAADSKVTVSSLTFDEPKLYTGLNNSKNEGTNNQKSSQSNGDLMQIPVNISVTGDSKESVMAFLKGIESTNRISKIDNVNIVSNENNKESDKENENNKENENFTLSITANYFYIVSKDKNSIQYNFSSGN